MVLQAIMIKCAGSPESTAASKNKAAKYPWWTISTEWGSPVPMGCWFGVSTQISDDMSKGIERVTRLDLVKNGLCGKQYVCAFINYI